MIDEDCICDDLWDDEKCPVCDAPRVQFPPPSPKLLSTFGMLEMEIAAEVIVDNGMDEIIRDTLFKSSVEKTGFYHLLQGGFLDSGDYNGNFLAGDEFKRRVMHRLNNPIGN